MKIHFLIFPTDAEKIRIYSSRNQYRRAPRQKNRYGLIIFAGKYGNVEIPLAELKNRARQERKRFKKYFRKLSDRKPKALDQTMLDLHKEVFAEMDCLQCANCCKTTSPIFRDIDIERIAQHLGMRPGQLVEQYLQLDDEGDYVLRMAPCPFLGDDNYCSIYDVRPRACREYPHTDRRNFHQILGLTLKNTEICPAVFKIVQQLEERLKV